MSEILSTASESGKTQLNSHLVLWGLPYSHYFRVRFLQMTIMLL